MSKVDELKVYTGKETIEALLEGKTLESKPQKYQYKFTDKLMTLQDDNTWTTSIMGFNNIMALEFTEVEKFKTGDIVYCSSSNSPGVTIIKEITGDSGLLGNGWNFSVRHCKEIRHATPEEVSEYKREQVFAKVDRKLNEFKHGDIVYIDSLATVATVITKNNGMEEIKLHGINEAGKGYTAKPHQLTPISFVEQQVDLS